MDITGAYTKVGKFGSQGCGFCDIKDLTRIGLTFSTRGYNSIQAGDVLKVNFALDDAKSSEIKKIVLVKDVNNHLIHAEFCSQKKLETVLISYLEAN